MIDPRPRVYLVQVCNAFGDAVYVPLAAGMLKAYAAERPHLAEHFTFETLIHRRFDLAETASRFQSPAVVGLSTYVWNWEFSLALARELRRLHPGVVLVLGGPQAPDDGRALIESGLVDVIVHGEGEVAFADVLEAIRDGAPLPEVAGVTARDGSGRAVRGPARARVTDLDTLPSPFLRGDFDPLLTGGQRLIGLWETNRGCPFSCTFCYWGSAINQKVRLFGWERLQRELAWFSDHRVDYVLSADANFGIARRDIDIARLVAETKRRTGFPRKFRVFSTKNASERVLEVIDVLHGEGLDQGMSLTMQTLSPRALQAIKRENIRLSDYVELARRAQERGIVTYSDLIVGLPGETHDSFLDGLDELMRLGQHDNVHVYHCTVLVGSEIGDPAYQARHGIRTARTPILERHMDADAIDSASIQEMEEVVVATDTMPLPDWIETNVATSIVNVLHYQKLAHYAAIFLHASAGASYRRHYELAKRLPETDPGRFPVLAATWRFARDYFAGLAAGSAPRLVFREFGPIVWPIEEAMFLLLSRDFDATYREIADLCDAIGREADLAVDEEALADVLAFQEAQTPRPGGPRRPIVRLAYDWPSYFEALLRGREAKLERRRAAFRVVDHHRTGGDLARFAREVVWYARSATNLPYRMERVTGDGPGLETLSSGAGSASGGARRRHAHLLLLPRVPRRAHRGAAGQARGRGALARRDRARDHRRRRREPRPERRDRRPARRREPSHSSRAPPEEPRLRPGGLERDAGEPLRVDRIHRRRHAVRRERTAALRGGCRGRRGLRLGLQAGARRGMEARGDERDAQRGHSHASRFACTGRGLRLQAVRPALRRRLRPELPLRGGVPRRRAPLPGPAARGAVRGASGHPPRAALRRVAVLHLAHRPAPGVEHAARRGVRAPPGRLAMSALDQAVVLCGGAGTRMAPLLGDVPKVLAEAGGRSLLDHTLAALAAAGTRSALLLAGPGGEGILDRARAQAPRGLEIDAIVEPEARGTAGALRAALGRLSERFLLVYGDVLTALDWPRLAEAAERDGGLGTLVLHRSDHPEDSDLVSIDDAHRVIGWVGRSPSMVASRRRALVATTALTNSGIAVLHRDVLQRIPQGRPCDLTEAVLPALVDARAPLHGYVTSEFVRDAGTPRRLEEARAALGSGRAARRADLCLLDRDGVLTEGTSPLTSPDQRPARPRRGGGRARAERGGHRGRAGEQPGRRRARPPGCGHDGPRPRARRRDPRRRGGAPRRLPLLPAPPRDALGRGASRAARPLRMPQAVDRNGRARPVARFVPGVARGRRRRRDLRSPARQERRPPGDRGRHRARLSRRPTSGARHVALRVARRGGALAVRGRAVSAGGDDDPVVLGVHAAGHEAGACIATARGLWALSEERLTRKKYDGGFPRRSIGWALGAAGVASLSEVDLVVYDLCEMKGASVEKDLRALGYAGPVRACRHHEAHAASAFFVSPFDDAAVLTLDAGGSREGETGPGVAPSLHGASGAMNRELQSMLRGVDNRLIGIRRTACAPPWNVNPGVLYGLSSVYLGFGPMGSGKLMGLAAHGAPEPGFRSPVFEVFDGEPLARFPGAEALREADAFRWLSELFAGVPPRRPEEPLTDRHANVAAFVQAETERAVIALAGHLAAVTGSPRLCFAGGFALNVTTNRRILDATPFRELFVQPAASDAGIPLGCALFGYHAVLGRPRCFAMRTAALGGEYHVDDIERAIAERGALRAERVDAIERRTAAELARGKIVGWVQGRSELGPRALGHRSILADARDPRSVRRLNEEIKFREPFRPYAPVVLEADAATYFDLPVPSPHMLLSAAVREAWRAKLPAIVHRDGSARVQTVAPRDEPRLAELLERFRELTGVPVLLNTSFNDSHEPIVETPGDALDMLLATKLDAVVIDDFWVEKAGAP